MTLKHRIGKILIPKLPIGRRSFDILRFELTNLVQRIKNALNPVYHYKVHKLQSRNDLSLNLGSGGRGFKGWINIDAVSLHKDVYIAYDIRRKFPLKDNSVKRIFAEQVIEHIDFKHDIPSVFREFHRILVPGGILRIIVPDAKRFLEAYVKADPQLWKDLNWDLDHRPEDMYTPMHIVNHVFHQNGEHYFGYDFHTMEYSLKKAGFTEVVQQKYKKSIDPELSIDRDTHALYSLYVEARKHLSN